MRQVHLGLKCQNLVKILISLQRLLTYLENDSVFKYNIQAPSLVFMTSLNLPALYAFVVCHYLCFFVYYRKVNDSNESVNIRTDENNSSLRDDIETPNMSESSSSAKLSTDDEIHPSDQSFANSEVIRCDRRLFDEKRYEKEYTWLSYNFNEKSYLCKICGVFYGEPSAKPGGSRGAWSLKVILAEN